MCKGCDFFSSQTEDTQVRKRTGGNKFFKMVSCHRVFVATQTTGGIGRKISMSEIMMVDVHQPI